ncbi:ATP-dependent RNA helicase HrpA [Ilumatobacter sp.]|uniref:ATP-dependent RNA helicase HrpA n=1 Tax=Ilumatobacter sp. TaxID=1967498 RepID=UPI003AF97D58
MSSRPHHPGHSHRERGTAGVDARRAMLERTVGVTPLAVPDSLPIADRADELVAAIRDHQVVIVAGETGSGKSTQLPKLCLLAGRGVEGMIGHTQPRRVAARTVAERVAEEIGTTLGDAVGYTVRFDDRVGDGTLLRVMTDGILLNELQRDRYLRRYDTLIIDEAHERSLNIDFILGYLKQLLPQRPDLKVIVTSATIDTERFAEHFGADGVPAPVFVVEGRTYPVEVRYRPYGADNDDDPGDRRDQVRAVIDAVAELEREGPGDVLVFLSGEREIHDIADALRREELRDTEVLPLYARLSSSEQHRIFRSHRGRRVVLSTNVAETSVTVPGVRYVIDAGTARISRYSRRLKVQRLPIEPVSQASAGQRAGRCGRLGPGVCVRLYTADDYDGRDEFTEPEILRTNLASVILQMTAIGLGDVTRFPFVEPPDRQAVRDGYLLLDELGALREGRVGAPRKLTDIGRQLARLPVDPRLGRMVIEAERQGCVREVLVIASALSIQDVRERPKDAPERAAELHRRFDVEGSDLLSIVALWDHLRERQRELSGNRFRRMCRDEHLNYLRVREWRDLYSQLRQVAGQLKIRPTVDEAHPDRVHQAVLAGLLSHIGVRDGDGREYRGARDARFVIAPGSVLARRGPKWVMAAELVETNRLWARRVATVQPEWAESIAPHLVKRSYGEPWWDARAGRAVVAETVTLYGLPIVAGRTIGVGRVDPALAREMFIRHALVAGDWETRHDFVQSNARFVERVALLEARVRRIDLLDDDALYEFYDERLGDDVASSRDFDRWWKTARRDDPERLELGPSALRNRGGIRLEDYPDTMTIDGVDYRLTYRFEPDTPLDGAALNVPLTALNQLNGEGLDWLVPGYRAELVGLLIRSLSKDVRRALIPMNETAAAVFERLGEPSGRLVDAVAAAVRDVAGVHVTGDDFDVARLPDHLRTHLIVIGDDGSVIDAGDDLEAIRDRQAGSTRTALAAAAPIEERRDIVSWDIGTLDQVVEQRADDGHVVRAYPTLLDRGDSVALRVVDNESLQRRAMHGGVRRLLLMAAAPTTPKVERSLDRRAVLAVAAGPIPLSDLAADAIEAAIDAVMSRYELPWDDGAFARIEQAVRKDAPQLAADALAVAADVVDAANRVLQRTAALPAEALHPTVADAEAHVGRLIAPGFVRRSGADRLPDVHRYVRGIEYRLDHLGGDVARDQRRMAEVRPLERSIAAALDGTPGRDHDVRELVWMIEELRMSTFAQPLGVKGPVSAKRIRQSFRSITGTRLD